VKRRSTGAYNSQAKTNKYNTPVNVVGGEWGMQEEANLDASYRFASAHGVLFRLDTRAVRDIRELVGRELGSELRAGDEAAKQHWEEHEVVVLDPNHGVFANLLSDDLGKVHVNDAVGKPFLLVEIHFVRMAMEEEPECGVRKLVVVAVGDVVVEVYCLTRVLLHEALVDYVPVLGRDIQTRRTDPSGAHRLLRAGEGGDESAGGHFEVVFALGIPCDGNWKTAGDDNEMLFWR
jgi:hypothetical protein